MSQPCDDFLAQALEEYKEQFNLAKHGHEKNLWRQMAFTYLRAAWELNKLDSKEYEQSRKVVNAWGTPVAESKKEFAFDILIQAVARIKAVTEKAARDTLKDIQCYDLDHDVHGMSTVLTEISVDTVEELFEIDGESVERVSKCQETIVMTRPTTP